MNTTHSYSCNRLYHLFNSDKNRDVHYREQIGRWTSCTNFKCPLRYNTTADEFPTRIPIPDGYEIPRSVQEFRIGQSHGQGPKIVRNPAPAGSTSTVPSPRVVSRSIISSPLVSLKALPEDPHGQLLPSPGWVP